MRRLVSFLMAVLLLLSAYGCTGAENLPVAQPTATSIAPTSTLAAATATPPPSAQWVPPTALVGTPIPGAEATLTAAPALNKETITFTNSNGSTINMSVEIADTDASRELGLMFRPSMPPDAGMLFDFKGDTTSGFWMQNTILPLTIAFIKADGTIISIQDMKPLDQTTINAPGPYRYALEANQGYFSAHNISVRNHVSIPGAQSVVIPGMPSCAQAAK